ncbi:MAG: helix-turn-helix domain-containing protein [Muribaculaceae bacterium]|nr:helix-turn-helix domain-containing protein [Muribaculaceae bacterium]
MIKQDYISNADIIGVLGQRIKEYRLAARMSQRELAYKSGVGYTTISHFEQGRKSNLTLNNFISLLRPLGMEERMMDILPELPMPPMALREINRLIPKRVRRKDK